MSTRAASSVRASGCRGHCGRLQQGCSFCMEIPEPHTCSAQITARSFLPSLSLHPVRSWYRYWESWEYHRTLPLPRLFTGEITRERNSAEQRLGPTEQPWEAHAIESHCHKQTGAERSSSESLSKPQTDEDPQPNVRPAGRSLAREESPWAGGGSNRMLQPIACMEGRDGHQGLHLLLVTFFF